MAIIRKMNGTAHRTEYWIIADISSGDEKSVDPNRSNIKVVITADTTVNRRHPLGQTSVTVLSS